METWCELNKKIHLLLENYNMLQKWMGHSLYEAIGWFIRTIYTITYTFWYLCHVFWICAKKSAAEELRSESPCIAERFDNKDESVGIPFEPQKDYYLRSTRRPVTVTSKIITFSK